MSLENKTAVITGGASGIGKGIVKRLVHQNCNIIVIDKDRTKGEILQKEHPEILFMPANLAIPSEISSAFLTIKEKYKSIDILINNAGISIFKPLNDLLLEDWDEILNTNLRAAFLCAKEFANMRIKGSFGRIINISSTRHLMSEPHGEAYAASKGGLVSLTHALAISMQDSGMTVNCISPGWIHTGNASELSIIDKTQHPAKRVGNVDDIANFCVYLCQPENDFITGQNFYIDGGMTKKMIYEE